MGLEAGPGDPPVRPIKYRVCPDTSCCTRSTQQRYQGKPRVLSSHREVPRTKLQTKDKMLVSRTFAPQSSNGDHHYVTKKTLCDNTLRYGWEVFVVGGHLDTPNEKKGKDCEGRLAREMAVRGLGIGAC